MRPSNNLENDSFRQILKSSASMYKSSASRFVRTTTGIQLESDAFDKSRFIYTAQMTIISTSQPRLVTYNTDV